MALQALTPPWPPLGAVAASAPGPDVGRWPSSLRRPGRCQCCRRGWQNPHSTGLEVWWGPQAQSGAAQPGPSAAREGRVWWRGCSSQRGVGTDGRAGDQAGQRGSLPRALLSWTPTALSPARVWAPPRAGGRRVGAEWRQTVVAPRTARQRLCPWELPARARRQGRSCTAPHGCRCVVRPSRRDTAGPPPPRGPWSPGSRCTAAARPGPGGGTCGHTALRRGLAAPLSPGLVCANRASPPWPGADWWAFGAILDP